MPISQENKEKLDNLIFERAYEIEAELSDSNFYLANLTGIRPDQIPEVALKIAIKELQKEFKEN